jgi:S-methylmethionine-dependent homocysteine/selenocysteine methylase
LPVTEPVAFVDKDGGLRLSYDEYRALERNIIAMREYAAQSKQIDECASKKELTEAIKHSDEMLAIMRSRVDEDRAAGPLVGLMERRGE